MQDSPCCIRNDTLKYTSRDKYTSRNKYTMLSYGNTVKLVVFAFSVARVFIGNLENFNFFDNLWKISLPSNETLLMSYRECSNNDIVGNDMLIYRQCFWRTLLL